MDKIKQNRPDQECAARDSLVEATPSWDYEIIRFTSTLIITRFSIILLMPLTASSSFLSLIFGF